MSGTAYSDANGQFTITVPASGRYHLSTGGAGCSVVHGSSRADAGLGGSGGHRGRRRGRVKCGVQLSRPVLRQWQHAELSR